MITARETATLAKPPRAFEVDASWYESYWYDQPRPRLRKPTLRFVQVLVWAVIFGAGAYVLQ